MLPSTTATTDYSTGEHVFWVDPNDPLVPALVLR